MGLTKQIKVSDSELEILKSLEWSEDGKSAKITIQLDRDSYVKVNKILEAMGGKWNRTAKAHLFQDDPRGQVEGLFNDGFLTVEKDGFFETPYPVFQEMLKLAPLPKDPNLLQYLEPSAGKGAIIKYLIQSGVSSDNITAIEKNLDRVTFIDRIYKPILLLREDFTKIFLNKRYDRIYMNPPFEAGQDIDHVTHAYDLLKPSGELVSVMSAGVLFNTRKKYVDFREFVNNNGHFTNLPEKSFHSSGTDVSTILVYIKKQ